MDSGGFGNFFIILFEVYGNYFLSQFFFFFFLLISLKDEGENRCVTEIDLL